MTYISADELGEADMARRKAANLIKGLAWLFMAAAVLPTFATSNAPTGEVTVLTLGLPWSPWLVYRESWTASTSVESGAPVFGYQAAMQPRCWSAACLGAGLALAALSRWLRAEVRPAAVALRKPTAAGA